MIRSQRKNRKLNSWSQKIKTIILLAYEQIIQTDFWEKIDAFSSHMCKLLRYYVMCILQIKSEK